MQVQRIEVQKDLAERKATADWATYMTTWESQPNHKTFLRYLLAEAARITRDVFPKNSRTYAQRMAKIRELSKRVNHHMSHVSEDKYLNALQEIALSRLFDVCQPSAFGNVLPKAEL